MSSPWVRSGCPSRAILAPLGLGCFRLSPTAAPCAVFLRRFAAWLVRLPLLGLNRNESRGGMAEAMP